MNNRGQSLMELVVGLGLISVVIGAIAVMTINTLRNTQFSRNQAQATKLAQENLEKVRTIKNSNFGICTRGQTVDNCTPWESVWITPFFGTVAGNCAVTSNPGCTYTLLTSGCVVNLGTVMETRPLCLSYSAADLSFEATPQFTQLITIEDEGTLQKRVKSEVFWEDATGKRSSNLVTIFSRI